MVGRGKHACRLPIDRCSLLATELKSDPCVCSVGATIPQIISKSAPEEKTDATTLAGNDAHGRSSRHHF